MSSTKTVKIQTTDLALHEVKSFISRKGGISDLMRWALENGMLLVGSPDQATFIEGQGEDERIVYKDRVVVSFQYQKADQPTAILTELKDGLKGNWSFV